MKDSGNLSEGSPFETRELRSGLKKFFQSIYTDLKTGMSAAIGTYKWGVYIFYDYDGEPIYIGQTNEKISSRIGRHLTNQRTDAVAMSVLDPFEVFEIEVYPLPEYEAIGTKHKDFRTAKQHLDALEYQVHAKAKGQSKFDAILNEKDPPKPVVKFTVPLSFRGRIVSDQVKELRGHADTRTARRALVIARLSQTIAERQVNVGLRRTLVTQAKRLSWLADERFKAMGGETAVETLADDTED
jgi:GIY-YIG catalytic domain